MRDFSELSTRQRRHVLDELFVVLRRLLAGDDADVVIDDVEPAPGLDAPPVHRTLTEERKAETPARSLPPPCELLDALDSWLAGGDDE